MKRGKHRQLGGDEESIALNIPLFCCGGRGGEGVVVEEQEMTECEPDSNNTAMLLYSTTLSKYCKTEITGVTHSLYYIPAVEYPLSNQDSPYEHATLKPFSECCEKGRAVC